MDNEAGPLIITLVHDVQAGPPISRLVYETTPGLCMDGESVCACVCVYMFSLIHLPFEKFCLHRLQLVNDQRIDSAFR